MTLFGPVTLSFEFIIKRNFPSFPYNSLFEYKILLFPSVEWESKAVGYSVYFDYLSFHMSMLETLHCQPWEHIMLPLCPRPTCTPPGESSLESRYKFPFISISRRFCRLPGNSDIKQLAVLGIQIVMVRIYSYSLNSAFWPGIFLHINHDFPYIIHHHLYTFLYEIFLWKNWNK